MIEVTPKLHLLSSVLPTNVGKSLRIFAITSVYMKTLFIHTNYLSIFKVLYN